MNLITIEEGQVTCQGFSKISLKTIKTVSYRRISSAYGIIIDIKRKPSTTWIFDTSSEAKKIHKLLNAALKKGEL